jgi:hypothetical protein
MCIIEKGKKLKTIEETPEQKAAREKKVNKGKADNFLRP